MRKWAKIKESFGCCISSREEATFPFSAAGDYITITAQRSLFGEGDGSLLES